MDPQQQPANTPPPVTPPPVNPAPVNPAPVNPAPSTPPPVVPPTMPTQPSSSPAPLPPTGPTGGKKTGLIIAVVAAMVVVGAVMAFVLPGMNKKDGSDTGTKPSPSSAANATPDPAKYSKFSVTDKQTGIVFGVYFYKDAKVEEKNGRTYLNSGSEGSMKSVYLGVATGSQIDCGKSSTTTMRLGGESTTVCYMADYTQYAGYAKTKTGSAKINLAGQKPISMDEAKTIMESVSF